MRAHVAANSLLQKAFATKTPITHLKLQKLLYFLHGWHMAITGMPVVDEGFQAWEYGPVVPSLYQQLRGYGANVIDDYIREIDPASGKSIAYVASVEDHQFWSILDGVWSQYSRFGALELSTLSHEANSAWSLARRENPYNATIDDALIGRYFSDLAANSRHQGGAA